MDKPQLFASYKVAYEVPKIKKSHTVPETLIKLCALDWMKAVLCEEAAKKTATDSSVRQCYLK